MSNITSILQNCTEVTTAVDATLSNNNTTYNISGFPNQTKILFTKKVTVNSGFVFNQGPEVDFSNTGNPSNYSVITVDTGSLETNNLTAREFTIRYLFPPQSSTDTIAFNSRAEQIPVVSTGKIYSYEIDESPIPSYGERRLLTINGDANATLTVRVRINGGADVPLTTSFVASTVTASATVPTITNNPDIYVGMNVSGTGIVGTPTIASITSTGMVLSTVQTLATNTVLTFSGSFTAVIGSNGLFQLGVGFTSTSSNLVYNIILTEIAANSFEGALDGQSPKTIAINQYDSTTITFSITDNSPPASGSFVLSKNTFTDTNQANRNNSVLPNYRPIRILLTASTSASGYSIILGAQEFTTARWTSNAAVQGKLVQLLGGTTIAIEDFSIVIDNSQSTKVATVSCLATILFHGSSDRTTSLNINDILTTQQ
tara:strand:- start:1068 stop:2357 length:1290 start_codon:yes stop_codon:yes gene_type:complete